MFKRRAFFLHAGTRAQPDTHRRGLFAGNGDDCPGMAPKKDAAFPQQAAGDRVQQCSGR